MSVALPTVAAASIAAAVVVAVLGPRAGRPTRPVGPAPSRGSRSGRAAHGPSLVARAGVRSGVGLGLLIGVAAVRAVGVPLVVGVGAALVSLRVLAVRRRRLRTERAVGAVVPEVVELFAIAASAGHPVVRCLTLVADRAPGPARPALGRARDRIDRGAATADALRALGPELGPVGVALVDALLLSASTGVALPPLLARVGEAARDRRRRTAEEAARRLPVTLLFPLACCTLPAFVVLAVVPLIAASISSLRV